MGIDANPPQQRMPDKLLNDDELRPYFQARQEHEYKMWLRSGGGTDNVAGIIEAITIFVSEFNTIQTPSVTPALPIGFHSTIKSESYTAIHGDFVEAQNNAIITLDPNAEIDDQIMVANGDGSKITVSGNIKYTKLDSSIIIRRQGTSLYFQNFGDYWRIR